MAMSKHKVTLYLLKKCPAMHSPKATVTTCTAKIFIQTTTLPQQKRCTLKITTICCILVFTVVFGVLAPWSSP